MAMAFIVVELPTAELDASKAFIKKCGWKINVG
jgi:predicted lactoylglutathione lyase